MKYLEELEKKVLHILSQNKELLVRCNELEKQVVNLQESLLAQELLISQQTLIAQGLELEKASAQTLVENLIATIDKIEKAV